MSIQVYCVGIHFRQAVGFKVEQTVGGINYMSGATILAECASQYGLRYKLSTTPPGVVPGHIDYVSYTPTTTADPKPRVTFPITPPRVFPFYGLPLSLTEVLAPIGELSQVLQYTVQAKTPGAAYTPPTVVPGPSTDGASSFGTNFFADECEIRIRLLSIYCTY